MRANDPKYKLVVNHVIDGVTSGEYKKGDWIPSINEFRQKYNLSRFTVFTGISELKSRGIIDSKPGMGYYISSTRIPQKHKIFLLFNEFNEFKEDLYNAFAGSVPKDAAVDIFFHNYNRKVFESLINDANGRYTAYVIMPGKFAKIGSLLQGLSGKVFLLDHFQPELLGKYSAVYQNFEKDTYEALVHGLKLVSKYRHIIMVQGDAKEPVERYYGLQKFCAEYGFTCEYMASTKGRRIMDKELYMLVNDRDLVDTIKKGDRQRLSLGKDFGIISYNDTPLKEILAGGITTLSTDFKLMGKTMAGLLSKKGIISIENPWKLIVRQSL